MSEPSAPASRSHPSEAWHRTVEPKRPEPPSSGGRRPRPELPPPTSTLKSGRLVNCEPHSGIVTSLRQSPPSPTGIYYATTIRRGSPARIIIPVVMPRKLRQGRGQGHVTNSCGIALSASSVRLLLPLNPLERGGPQARAQAEAGSQGGLGFTPLGKETVGVAAEEVN